SQFRSEGVANDNRISQRPRIKFVRIGNDWRTWTLCYSLDWQALALPALSCTDTVPEMRGDLLPPGQNHSKNLTPLSSRNIQPYDSFGFEPSLAFRVLEVLARSRTFWL